MNLELNKPESFKRNGFVIIRDIFDKQEVRELRELAFNLISQYDFKRQLMPSETLDDNVLRSLPFKEKILISE